MKKSIRRGGELRKKTGKAKGFEKGADTGM